MKKAIYNLLIFGILLTFLSTTVFATEKGRDKCKGFNARVAGTEPEVPPSNDPATRLQELVGTIQAKRSIFSDPFLFMTDIDSGMKIWTGLEKAFPLLAKVRPAVNIAHKELTGVDPQFVDTVIHEAEKALKEYDQNKKDPTAVDGAYVALNTLNEVFIRERNNKKQEKNKEAEKKKEEKKKDEKKEEKKKEEPKPPEEIDFPEPVDEYKPHNKDTEQEPGESGAPKPQVSIAEFNEPDIEYFKTDIYNLISPSGWSKVDINDAIRIQPAGGATNVLKVRVGKKTGKALNVHIPTGYLPLEINNADGRVWKDAKGSYKFESNVAELQIPMIPQGRAARPLSPLEKQVYTTPTGFKFEEWPEHFKRDIELLKSEYEKGTIDRMGVAKVVENLIANSKIFKYARDKDDGKDTVQLVNQGVFQCDTAATLAASVLRDEFKIPARIVGGDVGQGNPRTPLSSHVIAGEDRHSWIEVPDEAGNWHGFDPTPNKKDKESENKKSDEQKKFQPNKKNKDKNEDDKDKKDKKDSKDKKDDKIKDKNDSKEQDGEKSKDKQKGESSKSKSKDKSEKESEEGENSENESEGSESESKDSHEAEKDAKEKSGDKAPESTEENAGKTTKELIDMAKKMLEEKKAKEKAKEEAEKKAAEAEAEKNGEDKKGKDSDKDGETDNHDNDSESDSKSKKKVTNRNQLLDKIKEKNPLIKRLLQQLFDWSLDDRLDASTKIDRMNHLRGVLGSSQAKHVSAFTEAKELLSESFKIFNRNHPSFENWANQIVQQAGSIPLNETVNNLVNLQRQIEWTLKFRESHKRAGLEKLLAAVENIKSAIGQIRHPKSDSIRIVEEMLDNLPGNISRGILRRDGKYLGGTSEGANEATYQLAKKIAGGNDDFLNEMRIASVLGPHTDFLTDPVFIPSQGERRTILRETLPKRRPKGLQITNDPRDKRLGFVKLNPHISNQQALQTGQMAILAQNRYVKTPAGFKDLDPEKATILCVDISGSMGGDKIEFQAKYISALVDKALSDVNDAGKAKHRVYILPFDGNVYDAIEVTTGEQAAKLLTNKNSKFRKAGGSTDIEKVLVKAAGVVQQAGETAEKALSRATVVLTSDGGATINYKTVSDAFQKARQTKKHGKNEDLKIKFGFVAIGESNPDLTKLAKDSDELGADSGMYLEFDNGMIGEIMSEADRAPKPVNDFWTDTKYSDAPDNVKRAFTKLGEVNSQYRLSLTQNTADEGAKPFEELTRYATQVFVKERKERREGSQKPTLLRLRDTLDLVGEYFTEEERKRILSYTFKDWKSVLPSKFDEWDMHELSQIRHTLKWIPTGVARDLTSVE